ncbi:MAG: argininosuccinate lyase [Actinomycetota bacterium]|nr:argininosuccinate lyase [Actinomycetota bacterium]
MWGGRFGKEASEEFQVFSSSISEDCRLAPYEIKCLKAWSEVLMEAGILSQEEKLEIDEALEAILEELKRGEANFIPSDEDIHTYIERRLIELVGLVGGKIRTGRSRNDQVTTSFRMLVMEECSGIEDEIVGVVRALITQAEKNIDIAIPGQTHLQPAQPVLAAHALMAFVHMLERDRNRVRLARKSAAVLPLGSGALAGTTLKIDRDALARKLGFERACENSIDGVSDRDFALDILYALSSLMVHLSRLAEQMVIWSSAEVGLVELDDSWSSGSSLMPQKKNPDCFELIRGKAGRVIGELVCLLAVMKGLPLSYNRDMQEDKHPVFDAIDTVRSSLTALKGTIGTLKFDESRAKELLSEGYLTATDLAEYLTEKGIDFPSAHRLVGEFVSSLIAEGKNFSEVTAKDLRDFSGDFDEEALRRLDPRQSIQRRKSKGGTSKEQVLHDIEESLKNIS